MTWITHRTPHDRFPIHIPARLWERVAFGAVLLIAAFFSFFQLTASGYGNLYYAAAVKSMVMSWHNLFFVTFDPGGFVSIDKPPIDFWIQAASAKLLGFSAFSLLLPQALAGVLSVALLYYLVRRVFGILAGLLAALALALTPISVVASRANIVDGLLVLVVLMGALAASRAAETGRLRWLFLCAVLVGIGFNIKMLEAYLVVPAFALLYLLAAPHRWRIRLVHLALAGVVLIVCSLSWAVIVDVIPASQRPYVGSSTANSEIQLALGYNGLDRLIGFVGFGNRSAAAGESLNAFARGFSAGENGAPGPLRLLNQQLGNQVSWLLPLAVIGLLALCWRFRPRRPPEGWRAWRLDRLNRQQQAVILWGMWLLTQGVFFSIASFFHAYYLVMLAPAICALVGIGTLELWADFRRSGWQGWLLPVALVLTGLAQVRFLSEAPGWNSWLEPLLAALCLACASMLALLRLADQAQLPAWLKRLSATVAWAWKGHAWQGEKRLMSSALIAAIGVCTLLMAPTAWSAASLGRSSGMLPVAGPLRQGNFLVGMANARVQVDPKLVSYLVSHRGQARFLVATLNAMQAAPIILDTGQPVMALGGFMGRDPILTQKALAQEVERGQVRFFLLPANPLQGLSPAQIAKLPPELRALLQALEGVGGRSGVLGFNTGLTSWVAAHCSAVPPRQWSSTGKAPGALPGTGSGRSPIPGFGRSMSEKLYNCSDLRSSR